MAHDLQETVALLERTPMALDALLRGLPSAWTAHNEGGESWNAFDVLGHLIHGERVNWLPRAKMILEVGERESFLPFDRLGHVQQITGKSMSELLDEFAALRAFNMKELRAMTLMPQQLELRGQHPAFGSVTLGQLLATWAVHDLTHLRQISRIMAHQYREDVGPWNEYLGILRN